MPVTILKQVLLLIFWDNYVSKHHWEAASARYFLYSCKYVWVLWNYFGCTYNFSMLQNTFKLRENKSKTRCKIYWKLTIEKTKQNDVEEPVVAFSV